MSVSQPSKWLGIFLFLILPLSLFSQNNIKNTASQRCHTDEKMQMAMDADPSYKKALEEDLSKPMTSTPSTFGKSSSVVVTIPVHVIICHPPGQAIGTGVNFSLVHVESQITVLNEDFRRTNSDAGNTPSVFPAADVEIEFCLASVDPSGNATDGITRYGTNENLSSNENSIKSATGWNRNNYLNIWVGPNLGGILGWAYLPNTGGLPNATLDGVVTASTTFGGPGYGTNVPYHLGRTTTHEVGHYLGLRHVWGNGGCASDDNIADTPIQSSQNFGCPNHPSPSCSNGGDMFMNYMDYVNDNCMNAFTTGQGNRMHDILNSSRSSLLNSAATVCSGSSAPLALQLVSQTDVTCNLGNDGSITVLGSGGSGSYTYNINGGTSQNSNTFTGLTASTYIVEVSDGSSTITMNVTISEPPAIIPIVNTQTDVSCFGLSDGNLIIDGVGGTNNGAGYTYNIDGGPFSNNNFFTNLSGGIHTVIVKDENDCEGIATIIIDEPAELLSFVLSQTQIDCSGNNNGLVIIESLGGTPGFLYSFNGGGYLPNNVFTNLSQGVYLVETVDDNFCEHSFNVTITEPDVLQIIVQSQVNLNCFGENTGLIEAEGQGGTGSLQYQINNLGYQVNPLFENLTGGTYNLDVIDENGCVEGIIVEITEPSELVTELVNQTNVSCAGGLGAVTVNSVGGSGTPSVTLNGIVLSGNSVTFENLTSGVYPIIVADENNCEVFSSVEITGSPAVDLSITNSQNVNCNGENNGLIEAESSGGSGIFTYLLNGVDQGNNNVFTNLSGGTYIIESIDSEGCTDEIIVDITEPQVLTGQITQQTDINCFGENNGAVTIGGSGGMGSLTYTLGSETNTTGIFNGLVEGTYSVSVLDENNCVTSVPIEITQPAELVATLSAQQNINCSGGSTGAVTINSTGGTGTISVTLNGTTLNGNSVDFDNLSAGTYPYVVIDANNCQVNSSLEITENAEIELSVVEAQNVTCNGEENGLIEVEADGGTSNFTYFLNGVNQGNNNIFTNLSGGAFVIEITDGAGCDDEITVELTEPSVLNAQVSQQTNLNCFEENNGLLTIGGTGGTGVLEYTLGSETNNTGEFNNLPAGTYTVAIFDESNCTISVEATITQPTELTSSITSQQNIACSGGDVGVVTISSLGGTGTISVDLGGTILTGNSVTFENLAAGTYPILVSDENNCQVNSSVEITQDAEVELTLVEAQDVSCNGEENGLIEVEANGGLSSFTFFLNGVDQGNNNVFTNLSGGSYLVEITDGMGCDDEMTIEIIEPAILNAQLEQQTNLDCFEANDGTATVLSSGGTGIIEYTLGAETNTTGTFNNLAAGNYEVMVLDESGCSQEVDFEITEPSEVEVQIVDNTNVNCFGDNTGSLEISASGGAGNFEFNNGVETNSTGIFNNLEAGNYVVSISDANNCQTTIQSTISQPNELVAMISSQQDVNCFGDNSGFISLETDGGNGDITFELNGNSNTTGEFTDLDGGDYSIQITDENNCETTVNFEILEPTQLNIVGQNINQASCSGQEGTIQVSANGGAGDYEFSVGNDTNSTGLFEGFSGGIYTVQVTDQSGCIESVEVDINEPNSLTSSITQLENVNCNGANNGSVEVTGTGGIGAFTFTLGSETNSTGIFENLPAGNYSVILEDENNCNTTISAAISEPDVLEFEVMNVTVVSCFEGTDGMINLSSVGGTGIIQYTLGSETNTTGEFTNLEGGNYNVDIQDINGCTNSMDVLVDTPQEIVPMIVNNQNITCAGEENGMVELNATGGSNNFEYSYGSETNTTGVFTNIPSGSFTFFITDDNGCIEEVPLTFNDPQALTFENIQVQNIGCDGTSNGMIQLVANGGTGDLTFTIGNETNSTGQFEIQAQGSYEITLSDENNCTVSTQVEVEETAEIQSSILNVIDVTCFGENNGTANFMANGGTGTIQFTLGTETNTTGSFENLEAGIYNVLVNDDNNCFTEFEIEIEQPDVLEVNVEEVNSIACFGLPDGAIQAVALGGTGNLTYSLNNLTNTTGLFENLIAGTYEVLVTDGSGCNEIQILTIDQPDEISIEILNNIAEDCAGSATGLVEVQGLNGAGNFVYQMNNETNMTGFFENLSGGNYDLLMTDGNGCELTTMVTVDIESDISIESSSSTNVSCFGNENGTINIVADSPAGNLMYELDGMTNPNGIFENLPSGVYEVVVSDANNCSETAYFEILEPLAVNLNIVGIVPVDCFGESTGEAMLDAFGGNGEFSYTLNGETNNTGIFENLPAGVYNVDVIDSSGCTSVQEVEIEEPEELLIIITSTTSDTGTGTAGSDGTVTFEGDGGVGPYFYSIDGANFQSGEMFILLEGGEYIGYVRDANGCISQVVFIIESDIVDGIADITQGVSRIEILPNPFVDNLFLDADIEISQELELTMWTASGIEIYTKKIEVQKGNHRINLDINNQMPAGSYFLKVRNENGSIGYFKLIKY